MQTEKKEINQKRKQTKTEGNDGVIINQTIRKIRKSLVDGNSLPDQVVLATRVVTSQPPSHAGSDRPVTWAARNWQTASPHDADNYTSPSTAA